MGKIKKLLDKLDKYYGIKFDLDEQSIYEIKDDMDNIESIFRQIRTKLETYKEE